MTGLSIRTKLTALIFLGMLLLFGSGMAFVALNDLAAFRRDLEVKGSLAAALVARNSAADLAFEDRDEAARTLAALEALGEGVEATLVDRLGQPFASYSTRDLAGEETIAVRQPVIHGSSEYGSLRLRISTASMRALARGYLAKLALVALGAAALSLAFAWSLQRLFTRPVLRLAGLARRIAREADYSARAARASDDELGTLCDALNAMLDEIERRQREALEAIRVREEFLFIASHELRTPLTTLQLQLEDLRRALDAGALERRRPEEIARSLDSGLRQIRRLDLLVANLLDVTRLQSGRFQLEREEVDLAALARETVERHREELARARCEVTLLAVDPIVGRWDRQKIEQVMTNLLSNAGKYGAGKPVEVVAEAAAENRARFIVRDRGIGVAPADRQRIFAMFERAASAQHYGGMGLGLYITRQIVEAHAGAIRVDSEPGAGSTFTVELPR